MAGLWGRSVWTMAITSGNDASLRFLYSHAKDYLTPAGRAINEDLLADKEQVVRRLVDASRLGPTVQDAVQATAIRLVQSVRDTPGGKSIPDAFLREYDLSSQRRGRTSGRMLAAESVEVGCNRGTDDRSRTTIQAEPLPAAVA
jgi:hypothetical protein